MVKDFLELIEDIINRTSTVKGLVLFSTGIFVTLLFLLTILASYTIFIDREKVYLLISTPPELKDRLTDRDKFLVEQFYNDYSQLISSIHVVWYDKADRVIQIIYSYPFLPPELHGTRQYSVEEEVHTQHMRLRCVTSTNQLLTLRTSCPIFHGTDKGIEGYILAFYTDDNSTDAQIERIETAIQELNSVIGN